MLVGMGTPNITLPITEESAREIDIIPTWRYANCYTPALEIIQASKQNTSLPELADLITHRFKGIDSVPIALQAAGLSKDSARRMVVKVVFNNYN